MEAIVAVYSDWGIGSEGTQPIVIPEDRRRFAQLTKGATVIVGRRTMEDFPGGKPLKDRENLVITRHADEIEGATVVHTVKEAIEATKDCGRVFVIGGATVFMAMFSQLDRIYVTKIGAQPKSDAYFPNLDSLPDWKCTEEERFVSGEYQCSFCTYERVE
jgi:dihydrofolate reductase